MPITRRDLKHTSLARKLHSYADTFERKLYTEQLGIKNFRVLTLTKGRERVKNMQEAFQVEVGDSALAGLFPFAKKGRTAEAMLDWTNGNSGPVSIGK